MKIKRNLSDADMFRGLEEEESFETALLSDDSRRVKLRKNSSAIKKEAEAMMLPPEAIETGRLYGKEPASLSNQRLQKRR